MRLRAFDIVKRHLLPIGLLLSCLSCDALFSRLPDDEQIFDAPIDGLTEAQLQVFLAGDEAFGERFTAETGLGPVFNAVSCDSCHPGEGRGHPAFNLRRFGRGDPDDALTFDYLLPLGGPQLQDRAIAGYAPEVLPPNVAVSERGGPITVGLGLLEAVPTPAILALADPNDVDGDGISGRPNLIEPPPFFDMPADCSCEACVFTAGSCRLLGRFGRKATAFNLLHQTANAYHDDMGVTSDLLPTDVVNPLVGGGDTAADPELGSDTMANVVFYLQTLRPPLRRQADAPEVMRGEQLFGEIGCAGCHVPSLETGFNAVEPLSFVVAAAYTDLLLHDMGAGLADQYPEQSANGREWRTTPLWGVGIVQNLLGGEAFYLHDGRARTLAEAIGWHGGESAASRDAFEALGTADRDALLRFLESL